jgi:TPR repeat protein
MRIAQFKQLEQSAESGDANSIYQLALLFRIGKSWPSLSVPKNIEKSKELLQIASGKGHWRATHLLANFDRVTAQERLDRFSLTTVLSFKDLGQGFKEFGQNCATGAVGVIGITLIIGIVLLFFLGLAAIPVSIAVIIGAIIIAAAIRK